MPTYDPIRQRLICRIVYYGPGLCGMSTNLKVLQEHFLPNQSVPWHRTITLQSPTPVHRLPVELILQRPPMKYVDDPQRWEILEEADGIVFVADPQLFRLEASLAYLKELHTRVPATAHKDFPFVFQYNKQDLPEIIPPTEVNNLLNPQQHPAFEAIAIQGIGVLETFSSCVRRVLDTATRNFPLDLQNNPSF